MESIKLGKRGVVIGIGIPGAGKTTRLSEFALERGLIRLSPDDIRERLLGDYRDNSQNSLVWQRLYSQIRAVLRGGSVIVDGSGTNPMYRRQDIELYRSWGAERVIGVVFVAPLEVALARNAQRAKPVPIEGIHHFYELLTSYPPSLEDGFDEVIVVDTSE
jgi:predicted kinase